MNSVQSELDRRLRLHVDSYGLFQPRPGDASGNSLLFTAEEMFLRSRWGILSIADMERFERAVKSCEVYAPGLLSRHPTSFLQDQEGPDDYYGVAAYCKVFGVRGPCQRILKHGRTHFYRHLFQYYWRNAEPLDCTTDVNAWLGRQPGLPGLLQAGAGEGLGGVRSLCLSYAVSHVGSDGRDPRGEGGQDTWILSWIVAQALKGEGYVADRAVETFYRKLKEAWPGEHSMRQVFACYFQNPSHVYAQYFLD